MPCRISLVRDGEEAMEFARREGKYRRAPKPDVVLLDLSLPKKDGREVLTELKADDDLRRVPVVVAVGAALEVECPCRALFEELLIQSFGRGDVFPGGGGWLRHQRSLPSTARLPSPRSP